MNKQTHIERLRSRGYDWPIPWEAVQLIAFYESCALRAYRCPAGVWTCGWGETENVSPGTQWTEEQADYKLFESICVFTEGVKKQITSYTAPTQLGALVSLGYNIGLGALKNSTPMKAHNAGSHEAAARAFGLWNKARVSGNLVELPGLVARRADEAALYLRPDPDAPFSAPSVQAVEAESTLLKSPINIAGAVGVTTGATTLGKSMLDEAMPFIDQTKKIADTFGIDPSTMFGLLVFIVGAVAIYYRNKQRKNGWA